MKLSLTTWQRINCVQIVAAIKGANAAVFRKASKLLDILELTDTEKKEVDFEDGVKEGAGWATWKDKDRLFDVEIKDPNLAVTLKDTINMFTWSQTALGAPDQRRQVNDLLDQLGIE